MERRGSFNPLSGYWITLQRAAITCDDGSCRESLHRPTRGESHSNTLFPRDSTLSGSWTIREQRELVHGGSASGLSAFFTVRPATARHALEQRGIGGVARVLLSDLQDCIAFGPRSRGFS